MEANTARLGLQPHTEKAAGLKPGDNQNGMALSAGDAFQLESWGIPPKNIENASPLLRPRPILQCELGR